MKSALLLSLTEACSRAPQDDSVIQLTPSDCTGNSIWSDEERNCACAWGWSGNDCDKWEDSTCYYPEYSGNYEGNLNTSVTDLPCVSWTDTRVADFTQNTTEWTKGKLGEHNYCRNPDNDPVGFWCYVEEAGFEVLKPGYCKITECKLTHKSFLSPNTTNVSPQDSNAALDIIYGPVLPGVCGGVVALMTIVGFGEFLRRRRIFQKLRRRFDPEAGAPRRLGGVVTVDVDTGLQPELGNTQTTLVEKENFADSDDEELGANAIDVKKSAGGNNGSYPKLGALKEEEEDQDAITDRDEQTDSRIEKTEPLNSSGSSSDSEDELGTSASVQEEKREFEAGLSDLRHKLAQEVILEEEEEPESEGEKPDPNQPQFGMMKFRRSGKSVNIKSDDPDNPILEVSNKKTDINEPNNQGLDDKKNEKFQPMSIGSARSSSRNSFVLNTISRFETQSIASIKGEEMDVAINDIHNSKLSDYEEKRPSKHRKDRRPSNDSIQRLQESRLNHDYHDRGDKETETDDHRRKEERRKRREKEKRRRERREDERETTTKDEKRRERHRDRDRDKDRERRSRRKK